ncbi:unnamed protein product [Timema podura]|uniref:Solute carrier organic anion transporter family member 4A1 n=1 Tax=Timema podura TaxID=61482 RepID=A0ABN7PJR7_TIMPD|nr:unnamed protein product [Timema podura]
MSASCGLGSCFRPAWLQRFATPRHFVMVLGALGILQATVTMYFASTITTMEKRFKLSNQMTGIILSGVDISQAFLSLILSYYAGRGNAPLWMGYGLSLTSLACLLLALPHFIYGPGQDALALTKEYLDLEFYNKTTETIEHANSLCSAVGTNSTCSDADISEGKHSIALVALLFCAQIILGLGGTLYTTVGHTYLDDNSTKRKTPFLFSKF